MSMISQALHGFADFFKSKVGTVDPAAQTQLTTAATSLHAAADAVGVAVPILAEQAANTALLSLGPVGAAFAPAVDSFIEAMVAKLWARHSSAAPSTAVPPTPPT